MNNKSNIKNEPVVWHVTPVNDLKKHIEHGDRCWCEPVVEPLSEGGKMIVHNAQDGREFYEGEATSGL